MLSDTIIALSTLILAIAFLSGHRNIWLLFTVLMVRSAGTGIQTPAVNAVIPQIVPQKHLMQVNGIQNTLTSLIMFLSPAVSGAILSVSTLETTLFIDVFTALIGVGITSALTIPGYRKDMMAGSDNAGRKDGLKSRDNIKESSGILSMKQGFLYLKTDSFVRHLLLFQIAVLFLISPSAFLTPLMVSRTFGPEVWRLTASEMTYSMGSVLGGILITSWGGFKKRLKTTVLAGWLYGVLMAGLGVAPGMQSDDWNHIPLLQLPYHGLHPGTGSCFHAGTGVQFHADFHLLCPSHWHDGIRPPGRCGKDTIPSHRRRYCRHGLYSRLLFRYNKAGRIKSFPGKGGIYG